MNSPEDHPVLDRIFVRCGATWSDQYQAARRESECVEFYDSDRSQWYEIVVRPIDEPSGGGE